MDGLRDREFACLFGNRAAYERIRKDGVERAFYNFTLLRDREDSNAWNEWFWAAGLHKNMRFDTLIIPDPNVRVQAVLDGQGVALNDELIEAEVRDGKLFRLSSANLETYGYFLAYEKLASKAHEVAAFLKWIKTA